MLRDCLGCGINEKCLLAEAQLDFNQTLQLALSLENAVSGAQGLQGIPVEVDTLTCPTELGKYHLSVHNRRASLRVYPEQRNPGPAHSKTPQQNQASADQGLLQVAIYRDDVLITGKTHKEHVENLDTVLKHFFQGYFSRRPSVDVDTLRPSAAAFVNPQEDESQRVAAESSAPSSAAQKYSAGSPDQEWSELNSSSKTSSDQESTADASGDLSSENTTDEIYNKHEETKRSAKRHTLDWSKLEADKDQDESKFTKPASNSKKSSRKHFSLDLLNYKSSLTSIQSSESEQDRDEGRKSPRFSLASDVTGLHSKTKATAEEGQHQGSSQQEQEPPTQPDSSLDSVKRKLPKTQLPRSESEAAPDQNETISKSPATADEVNREETEQQEGDGWKALLESDSNPQISEAGASGKVSDTSSDQAATKVLGQAPEGEDIFEMMVSLALNELEMEASDTEEQRRHLKTGDRSAAACLLVKCEGLGIWESRCDSSRERVSVEGRCEVGELLGGYLQPINLLPP
ncbi:uncharacterized protein LOC132817661 [Hemiscyllium ocellatum]|uniref:uncharacterized protein LOC132817661 n=1 Tax=Hemiscyllium ocellatum TaxID=170820 RepID=UPI002966B2AA|nr:uncharacterized protein LOC132817661 [Hemiscyllium ocellatum]